MPPKAKVILVDDHPLVREWLANLIDQQPDLEVCGEADGPPRVPELVAAVKPDVAIVDISLDGGSGIDLIKDLKALHPGVGVIVLSMHDENLYAERAIRAGARGYVMKREATQKVLEAIRCVLGGRLYLSTKITALMAESFAKRRPDGTDSPLERLSYREREVFQLLGRGLTTRQIAEELHVQFKTVQTFNARIKEKLRLANANELLREAVLWHENGQQ